MTAVRLLGCQDHIANFWIIKFRGRACEWVSAPSKSQPFSMGSEAEWSERQFQIGRADATRLRNVTEESM